MLRVKDLVAGHNRHQIFRLGQVDDVVCPAGDHVNGFNLIAGDLKLHRLIGVDIALLNQTVSSHYNEQLPLAVVPVLPLRNSGAADVDRHLSTVRPV